MLKFVWKNPNSSLCLVLVGLEPIWELFSVMLWEYLRVLGLISGKREEMIKKFGQGRGSFAVTKGPLAATKCFTAAWPRRGFFHPRVHRGITEPQRSAASSPRFAEAKLLFIKQKIYVLYLFVIPFFRGHVYRTNEDPISVYKGPFMLKR